MSYAENKYFDSPPPDSRQDNLANLHPVSLLDTLAHLDTIPDSSGRRNRFITANSWIPGRKREVTLASHPKGPAEVLFVDRYAGNNRGRSLEDQLKAPAKDYEMMLGSMRESRQALRTLRQAVVDAGEDWGLDPDQLTGNPAIRDLFVEHVLNYRQLDAFDWLPKHSQLFKDVRTEIEGQVDALSPKDRERLWEIVRESHVGRLHYWGSQIHVLRSENKIVREIELQKARSAEYNLNVPQAETIPESPDTPEPKKDQDDEVKPWHKFKPNIPAQIEGTDVPLVTEGPVSVVPRPPKKTAQSETLFNSDQEPVPKSDTRPVRPVRGKLAMFADVQAARSDTEKQMADDSQPLPNPDADIDEIFGSPRPVK